MRYRFPMLAWSLVVPASGWAADYCVSNETQLRNQLQTAQLSPEADDVRIREGTLSLTQSLLFSRQQGSSTGALTLSGGWNADCSAQKPGAQWTQIEGGSPTLTVSLNPSGDLFVHDLHFVNLAQGVQMSNDIQGPSLNVLRVSRLAIFNDEPLGDALQLFSPADRIEIDNVLVDANAFCAIAGASFDDAGEWVVRSSTVISRAINGNAICFDGAPAADLNAGINTVFNASQGIDILVNGRPIVLQSSAYSDLQGCQPCGIADPLDPQSSDNLVQPMIFDATATGPLARFVRVALSTLALPGLVDTGSAQNTLLYPYDVIGYPRLAGAAQDRGAFEVPNDTHVFANGFEQ